MVVGSVLYDNIIISAPSGTGKTTVIQEFLKHNPYWRLSKSHTTRQPRHPNDKEYHFISHAEFTNNLHNFIEYEKVYNNYYGIHKDELLHRYIIFNLDTKGALKMKQLLSSVVSIFLLPPSIDILQDRLRSRQHNMSEEEICHRLSCYEDEIRYCSYFDHVVVNDSLSTCVERIDQIIYSSITTQHS